MSPERVLRPQGDLRRVRHRVPGPTHCSQSKGSSRTWITMTPRSRRYYITDTEYMSSTPSEKGCLSDSRRRPRPKRTVRPAGPLAQELKVENAKIQTLLD